MPDGQPLPEVTFLFESDGDSSTTWKVIRAHAREALSEVYEVTVDLACDDASIEPDAMLSTRAILAVVRESLVRRFLGIIRRVDDLGSSAAQRLVRVFVVPELWALGQRVDSRNRVDSRVFQDKNSLDIVRAVLDSAGLYPGARFDISGVATPPPVREYCVQYRETDLAFVQRLLEEDGVGYYFLHSGETENFCVFDTVSGFSTVPTLDNAAVSIRGTESSTAAAESIRRFDWSTELRPTGSTVRDYNFTRPEDWQNMTRTQPKGTPGAREIYDSPAGVNIGGYDPGSFTYTVHDGKRQSEMRQAARTVGAQRGRGLGNVTGMVPGKVFGLTEHGRPDLDGQYVLTRLEHSAHAADLTTAVSVTAAAQSGEDRYHNTFECVKATVPWRPARVTPRPVIHGSQTAKVVGPAGEEIFTDHHGRIKVQFHWDREGVEDPLSSAWVRVQQAWAGPGWGFVFIPRIGMEVVVTFLEGDPDRPLVTGSVYNGQNPPPYPLPAEKTKSTIKSASSLGSNGFNEFRFEDLAGSEEIYLHAQKDFNEVVLNDHNTTVGNDQTNTVGRDQTEMVKRDRSMAINRNDTHHIVGHQAVQIDGSGALPSPGPPAPGASLNITGEYFVEASQKITLKVGGSTLVMVPGSITLTSGGNAVLCLDPNAHLRASGGGDLLLDGNVNLHSNPGSFVVLDANAHVKASTGGDLVLDANAHLHGSPGGDLVLDANATMTASGGGKLTLDADGHLHGADVKLDGSTLHASGGGATITLAGTVSIKGTEVDLNG